MHLWAQVKQTHFQFTRVNALTEAWHWLLLVLICLAFGTYVVWVYKRDTKELRKSIALTLIVLRCCALLGILFYFFFDARNFPVKFLKEPTRGKEHT